jgi:hypothetical protein
MEIIELENKSIYLSYIILHIPETMLIGSDNILKVSTLKEPIMQQE